jgi:hypothetical protein
MPWFSPILSALPLGLGLCSDSCLAYPGRWEVLFRYGCLDAFFPFDLIRLDCVCVCVCWNWCRCSSHVRTQMAARYTLGCHLKVNTDIREHFFVWERIIDSGVLSLMGRPQGKRQLWRPRRSGRIKLRRVIKKQDGGSGLDWSGSG